MTEKTDTLTADAAKPIDVTLLFLAAAIYGGIFPVNRLAAEAAWPPLSFAFLQALVAGIVLCTIVLILGRAQGLTLSHLRAFIIMGGLVIGLPIGILVAAAEHVDASVLSLVLCLAPIVTIVLAAILRIEPFRRRTLYGAFFGTAGIAIIVMPEAGVIHADAIGWFLLALAAPVMFAGANICAKVLRPPAASSLVMAAGTLMGAAVVALAVTVVMMRPVLPGAIEPGMLTPLVLASAINGVFFFLFYELISRIGPARFSLFNYLAVGAGILWSMVVFHEQPALAFWFALVLMLAGMRMALKR